MAIVKAIIEDPPREDPEMEDMGLKIVETPDNTIYNSDRLKEVLDVGWLPQECKKKAWETLEKRKLVFGFDGRLGNNPAKAHIRLKEGKMP